MKQLIIMVFSIFIGFSVVLPVQADAQFSDVPKTYAAYEEIQFLSERDIVQPSKLFGVATKVTREEIAVQIGRSLGFEGAMTQTKFRDVTASNVASGYIQSAVTAGIINGYSDGTFRPKELVTRGQMAAFLVRGFQLKNEKAIQFKDVASQSAAYPYVRKLVFSGITKGYSDGTFRPYATLTRTETAIFLARALGYSKELTTPEIAKKTESKIVTMHLKNAHNEWVATGIVIGDGYILVNMYAIDGVTSGKVITSDNRSFELQGAAFANDSLAIMKTKEPMGVVGIPLQPSVKTLVKNERIVTVELEEGKSGLYVTEGKFDSSFYSQELLYNSTFDEASLTMPGGAVVNARGYLIGLQTKGFRSPVRGARISIASDEIIQVFQPFRGKKFGEVPAPFYSSPM